MFTAVKKSMSLIVSMLNKYVANYASLNKMFPIVARIVSKRLANFFVATATYMTTTHPRSSFTVQAAESAGLGAVKTSFTATPVGLASQ
jgi:hypothetical protein